LSILKKNSVGLTRLQYDMVPGSGQSLGLLVLTSLIPQLGDAGVGALRSGLIAQVCLRHRRSGQLVGVDLFVDCAGPGKRCLLVHLLEDLDDPEDEAEADGDEPA
jgi:hypothetical protein